MFLKWVVKRTYIFEMASSLESEHSAILQAEWGGRRPSRSRLLPFCVHFTTHFKNMLFLHHSLHMKG
jgi:hypothetical protein